MKTIIVIMMAFLFVSCQQKETEKNVDYLRVHKELISQNYFENFVGYEIISLRQPNYYMINFNFRPNVSLFVTYLENNKVDRKDEKVLKDSLAKYYPNAEEEKEKIYNKIGNLIAFMQQETIRSMSYKPDFSGGKGAYFIDYYLSQNETLRYYCFSKNEIKSYPKDVIVATWIDSSWVYLKSKPPEDMK
jgi:hypothetical protein